MKALDQRFRARVAVTIEHTMRLPVSSEKSLQAQYIRLIGPSDDDRPACAAFQQAHAAQDQRPHDALAKVGLLHHQIAQSVRANDECLNRLDGLGVHERRTGGELCKFARELSRLVRDDDFAPLESAALGTSTLPGNHDQSWRRRRSYEAPLTHRIWFRRTGAVDRYQLAPTWETSERGGLDDRMRDSTWSHSFNLSSPDSRLFQPHVAPVRRFWQV
jgi:hypothetical protein